MSTCACGVELETGQLGVQLCPACLLQLGLDAGDEFEERPETPGLPRLLALVGQGPRGLVYLGHPGGRPGGLVSVKFIDMTVDTELLVRRLQQTVARLWPPIDGVALLLDCGITSEGSAYVVSQYVPGPCLGQYLHTQRPGAGERVRLMVDICSVVSELHRRDVVHGGLKPTNIIVTESSTRSRPVLLDTGICAAIDQARFPAASADARGRARAFERDESDDLRALHGLAQEVLTDAGNERLRKLRGRFLDRRPSYATASQLAFDLTALGASYGGS
jgi:serine/threonine protein kinase